MSDCKYRFALEWNPQALKRRDSLKQSWRRSAQDELSKRNITWIEAKKNCQKLSQMEVQG